MNFAWRKSSYSAENGNCVEVATNIPDQVAMRDSKNPGPMIVLSAAVFDDFIATIKAGKLDELDALG